MPVLSYVHQLFNVDQCQAYIHTLRWAVVMQGARDRTVQTVQKAADLQRLIGTEDRPVTYRATCSKPSARQNKSRYGASPR